MTTCVESTAPESPAASAKGTVKPSDMPMTMSRTRSPEVKCFSVCGVEGMDLVGMAQDFAGKFVGHLAVGNHRFAIDEHELHAGVELVGVVKGGAVGDGGGTHSYYLALVVVGT